MARLTVDELRRSFLDFFVARKHTEVPSAGLISLDPTLLFTIAGMVPFIPYFNGTEVPPFTRATSSQKCVRAGGKRNDLEEVGHTNRHMTFFEMLGNFSFGDYFKEDAIKWAWEYSTEVLQLDPNRIWVTVHETDDEAAEIWERVTSLPAERIQRLGEPNYWRMADVGPCGPSSELFWDFGEEYGEGGGPAKGSEDRYLEFWNLVFMEFDAQPDGTIIPLPKRCIDTGAGLERILAVVEDKQSVWDTTLFQPLIRVAEQVTGTKYGTSPESDVSLRILAEHARTMTFLVSDGVVPSNEERGYVLRRIIRRAIRHAFLLGSESLVTPQLVAATVELMGDEYPELRENQDRVTMIVEHEEEGFRQTLERGLTYLDQLLTKGDISGDDAFFLHDTMGFPIDLTREIAEERSRRVDVDGFTANMTEQQRRGKESRTEEAQNIPVDLYRGLLDEFGPTEFTGRQEYSTEEAKILAIVSGMDRVKKAKKGDRVSVVLDRTPFYAESGGQIGDTGEFTADGTKMRVLDTKYGLWGTLHVHECEVVEGSLKEGDVVTATIDGERRDAIRRNHTGTHILHWALREVLGKHVKQAGSLVAPDRLRFDFSHFAPVSQEELDEIEALANKEIISDAPCRHYETTMDHARELGAIAFFGEKYGEIVRVLEAGENSIELCGGTHVHRLGFIGPMKIVSEGSIGANMRRIEAFTGTGALERIQQEETQQRRVAELLKAKPNEVPSKVERLIAQVKEQQKQLEGLRAQQAVGEARELVAKAKNGVLVARQDGSPDELRRMALAARDAMGSGVVGLVGLASGGEKASIAVAVSKDKLETGLDASVIVAEAARLLGGGTAKNPEVVTGGGPNVKALDDALKALETAMQGTS